MRFAGSLKSGVALVVLGVGLGTFVWGQYGPPTNPPAQPAPDTVNIQNFEFSPRELTVPAGTTVNWVNLDSAAHTTTSRTNLWNSGNLNLNQRFSFTFTQPGTYDYFCALHPFMEGKIIVAGQGQAASPAGKYGALLDRQQEVPAPAALPMGTTPATGTGYFELNAAQTELSYHITYVNLTGAATAMHFHKNKAGEAGPVVKLICGAGGPACPGAQGTVAGVWKSTDAQPLSPDMIAALKAGELYVNVHTAVNPAGEIRGQIR
jgi:plastocyanin